MPEDGNFTITIEFDGFLTRFDLNEILSSIDFIIEDQIISHRTYSFDPILRYFLEEARPRRRTPLFSYLGITSVSSGSITFTVLLSSSVILYVAKNFKKGFLKGSLDEEISRSGLISNNFISNILRKINDWAEKYVDKKGNSRNVKKIIAKQKDSINEFDDKR